MRERRFKKIKNYIEEIDLKKVPSLKTLVFRRV